MIANAQRCHPVHPHVRGDDGMTFPTLILPGGSPPRAWGRLAINQRLLVGPRFTPTCVGTTSSPRRRPRWPPVHPHVRGDDPSATGADSPVTGSPPRAWGRLCECGWIRPFNRFTPTCVGTTPPRRGRRDRIAVHPHVRGDDDQGTPIPHSRHGSPPRAWGRLSQALFKHLDRRFTPTCVGTTRPALPPSLRGTVHPHVRGDDFIVDRCVDRGIGSPPRAWGRRRTFAERWP